MKANLRKHWSTLMGFLVFLAFIMHGAAAPQRTDRPRRHALVIGVTKYPNLAEQYQLEGPLNDVALVRTTLVEKLGFAAKDIVELSEGMNAAGRPTRGNIRGEFERFSKTVSRGDQEREWSSAYSAAWSSRVRPRKWAHA